MAIVAGFSGNFPLNDDWSYGEAVRTFLSNGQFVMPTVCAAGFLHVLWGALFCSLTGFSYEALRFSSVVASAIGMLSIYGACRTLGAKRQDSLFCCIVYAANPIMLNITLSFMSDSTGLAAISLFLFLFFRAVKERSYGRLCLSSLVLVAAICIRQSAVILAPAALLLAFVPSYLKIFAAKSETIGRGISVITVLVPALFASYLVDKWLMLREANGSLIVNHYGLARQGHQAFVQSLFNSPSESWPLVLAASGEVLSYLGLFLLPLFFAWMIPYVMACFKRRSANIFTAFIAPLLILAPSAAVTILKRHLLMPFSENIWRVTSTGALGIMGITNPVLRRGLKNFLTGLAYAHAFWLLSCFLSLFCSSLRQLGKCGRLKKIRVSTHAHLRLTVLLCFLLSLGFLTVETLVRCMDRYYLIGLAPALILVCLVGRYRRLKLVNSLSLFALVFFVLYSFVSAQDYMAANRARWACIAKLEAKGLTYTDIDGGAEYNIVRNMKVYSSDYRGESPRRDWRWWPINGERYIVSFSTIPDYDLVDQADYYSLLTQSKHSVYVLKKAK